MSIETRSAVAEQARVYALFGLMGVIGCFIGFGHQLHVELGSTYGDDEFGWPLAMWLAGGVLSAILLLACATVAWMHRYFSAVETAEARGRTDSPPSVP